MSDKLRPQHGEQCRTFPQFHPKTVRFIDEIVVSCTDHHVMNTYGAGGLAPRVVWPQHEMDVNDQILVPALLSYNEPLVSFRQVAKCRSDTLAKRKTPYASNNSQKITSMTF